MSGAEAEESLIDPDKALDQIEALIARLRSELESQSKTLNERQMQRAFRIGFNLADLAMVNRPIGGNPRPIWSSPSTGMGSSGTPGTRVPVTVPVNCPICTQPVSVTLS